MSLLKLIAAMDDEYPILEYLIVEEPAEDKGSILILPETLQALHIRHLILDGWLFPSDRMLITHDCCERRHAPSLHGHTIHLLPSKYSVPMAFIHAPARDAHY